MCWATTRRNWSGKSVFHHVHPDDVAYARRQRFNSCWRIRNAPSRCNFVTSIRTARGGIWRPSARTGSATRRSTASSSIRRDVTDRWQAEEELRNSEKQYRLLFHGNPNPMWVFDLETLTFLEVNEAAVQHYGYSREEFLAMTITDIRPPEKAGERKAIALASPSAASIWRHRRKDGSLIDVEVIWSPMAFRGRFAALTMAMDVTERRRVEHRNAVFSKLSHQLSSATTAPEAAMIICEAADALFQVG